MRTIWYMGAKTRLSDAIAAAIAAAAPRAGAVLDLMSGTAAVSQALASRYEVHANDAQAYATAIAQAYLQPQRPRGLDVEADLGPRYHEHMAELSQAFAPALAVEDAYLRRAGLEPQTPDPEAGPVLVDQDPKPKQSKRLKEALRAVDGKGWAERYRAWALDETPSFHEDGALGCEVPKGGVFAGAKPLLGPAAIAARRLRPITRPYCLVSAYYPNVYFGIRQSLALDSLRYAIDGLADPGRKAHYLAALLHAASVATSATSHFCQPRGLTSASEVKAVLRRRSIALPSKLQAYAQEIAATRARTRYAPGNSWSTGDWRQRYARWSEAPADVVYVDPPYTADNYSRFYHALEVITRYDYPILQRDGRTKGRYPALETRFRSPFSEKRQVEAELEALIEASAARGATLVMSYGLENGLLLRRYQSQGLSVGQALRRFQGLFEARYRDVSLETQTLMHSGQGDSNLTVTELLLTASQPRSGLRRRPRSGPGQRPRVRTRAGR